MGKGKSKKNSKNSKNSKKWITAFESASKTYKKTRNFSSARKSFRKRALRNIRKLYSSI